MSSGTSGGTTARGPLAPLDGVPGVTGAVVRAGVVALVQTVGMVALAAGLAQGVAAVVDGRSPLAALALAAAGALVRAAAGSVGAVLAARDARRSEDQLRGRLLDRLTASPAAVEAAGGPGPAAVLVTTRLHDLAPALATYLPAFAQTLVVPPVLLLVLLGTDWLSAVLIALTLPLVPVFMVLVGKYTADRTADSARALDRIAGHVAELVRGLPVLTGLGRAAEQTAALARLGEDHRRTTTATLRLAFLSSLVLELIATLSVALVAVTVGLRLVHGHLGLGIGLTALLLAPEAFAPLRALGAAYHANADAGQAAADARAVLAAPAAASTAGAVAATTTSAAPVAATATSGAPVGTPATSAPVAGSHDEDPRGADLVVEDLAVSHPGRTASALPPTSLRVHPGQLVALTGASGSGKSTLLAALAGTLPSSAEVTGAVAGVPARVAVVPQHPRTVGDTVADELRLHAGIDVADPLDAVVAEGLVVDALARVGAGSLAGRRCTTLSPGELQRVALARALVRVRRGAGLLLLDEPTAHLDDAATARVTAVLTALRGTVTTVLVTHDPELAALADREVVLPALAAPPAPASPVPGPSTVPATVQLRSATRTAAPTPATATAHSAAADASGVPDGSGGTDAAGWPRAALARAVGTGTVTALAGVALTGLSGWLVVRAAEMPPVLTLLVAIVGVRGFGLLRAVARWAERLAAHDAALRLASSTRVSVWRALARQGIAAERTPGTALGRVVGDVALLQDLSVRVLTPPAVAAATALIGCGVLALLSPAAAAGVLAVLLVVAGSVVLLHRRVDADAARAEATLRVTALEGASTVLEGAADLRAHGLAVGAGDRVRGIAAAQRAAALGAARTGALADGVVSAGTGLAAVVAAGLGWATGLTGPVLAVVALAPLALAEPLTGWVGSLQRRGAWDDVRARVDAVRTAPVAPDPATPSAVPVPVDRLTTEALVAGWPGGPDVLREVSSTADRDGWLVVRGPSGAGKSTLLAVLLAALRPRAGRYDVAGTPATDLVGDDLRTAIAWVPQEAHVFASSIRANLALAGPRGSVDEVAMIGALTVCGLGPLVAGLPDGLDTAVGSGGAALSGGERRRLAAARALLADRDVVLLDEPTAHLDGPTAAALVADLRRALAGRVVVCVTHDDAVAGPDDTTLTLDARVRVGV
ncbi:ATP-binding cassette, subfamily C, CydCD [Klenkia marina]|uniref:ATP-binding cassette, subfamily C, CydCD n=1 Tax=Klenkia marina TaxID=1960309 RepID=A0A1G4YTT7_9ACTN|nr:thiol reductant ABC exporter subunit CydC [Klenkia marina]SCX56836.1 ATP-binding cassette, subfamily C, CydCD [Klenkia marina]